MKNKYHIEKNTVQETLMIPLYGRKLCNDCFPDLYKDEMAETICNSVDYDFNELNKKSNSFFYKFGALEAAMRNLDIAYEVNDYLKTYPEASVVNLGCGLDCTGHAVDNGRIKIYNIDFPDIIDIRNNLIPDSRETNIGCDLNDTSWMDKIDSSNGVIMFASGVFHYFSFEQVDKLINEMAKRFKGGRLVFDTVGTLGHRLMMKKVLKNFGITDVSGYFHVDDVNKELKNRFKDLTISSRDYMLGYYDLKQLSTPYRVLSKIGDKMMNMKIVRIDF